MTKTATTPKFVSSTFASHWYNLGTQYSDYTYHKSAIRAAIEDGLNIDCWEKAAAFAAGWACLGFEVKAWKRYGYIPCGVDGFADPSINHASNDPELGVSVATSEWENSIPGLSCISALGKNPHIVYFTGLQVGYGSDGEPVVLPIKTKEVSEQ